ncbi:hypothetical protein [Teichococcus wenyumeiae]|uniref:hypothetical protein n=1 Tax=Teichococcus wenyumeiae TaxID=2478470 RepID=UPI0011C3595C|nr:hypothetical protein [Pseudoroseomonas wenyumeiae]
MFDCTCPASRGLQGRICGVNHPNCEALQGLTSAALGVVVTPTLPPAPKGAAVPTAATTDCQRHPSL